MSLEFPVVLRIAGLSVSAHLVLETLAFIIGYQYYLKLQSGIGFSACRGLSGI